MLYRLSYRGGSGIGANCPHSGSTVSVRGNRTEGAYPPVADLRPTGYGGWATVDAVKPVSSAPPVHWSGEPAKPDTDGGMYPPRFARTR